MIPRDVTTPCMEGDPDAWVPTTLTVENVTRLKRACARCPERPRCREDAMDNEGAVAVRHRFGVWGGLTPTERYELAAERYADQLAGVA